MKDWYLLYDNEGSYVGKTTNHRVAVKHFKEIKPKETSSVVIITDNRMIPLMRFNGKVS